MVGLVEGYKHEIYEMINLVYGTFFKVLNDIIATNPYIRGEKTELSLNPIGVYIGTIKIYLEGILIYIQTLRRALENTEGDVDLKEEYSEFIGNMIELVGIMLNKAYEFSEYGMDVFVEILEKIKSTLSSIGKGKPKVEDNPYSTSFQNPLFMTGNNNGSNANTGQTYPGLETYNNTNYVNQLPTYQQVNSLPPPPDYEQGGGKRAVNPLESIMVRFAKHTSKITDYIKQIEQPKLSKRLLKTLKKKKGKNKKGLKNKTKREKRKYRKNRRS